ncbi:MAG: T9SS type A sorting domain-containing protein [Bacteroidia bacterium]
MSPKPFDNWAIRTITNPNIELSNVRITNLVGQVVYTSNDNNRSRQIDLTNVPRGYYFVTLTSKNEVVNKKILIRIK